MNDKVNYSFLAEHSGVQYGDFTGLAHVDLSEHKDIYELCKEVGINADDNFIVAFGISASSIQGIHTNENIHFRVMLINKEKYGNSYDEIQKNLINSDGKIEIHVDSKFISVLQLLKCVKRFDCLVASSLSKYVVDANFIEE